MTTNNMPPYLKYDKALMEAEISSFLGEEIKDIYYYKEHEGYTTFSQLADELVEVPLLGILLHTSSDHFFNIVSSDYYPYYGLGGIRVFQNQSFQEPRGRPNHISEANWRKYSSHKITKAEVIETFYRKSLQTIVVPFGIKVTFEGGEELHITNLTIEGFVPDKQLYSFSRGGEELVIFFNSKSLEKHEILKMHCFEI